MDRISNAVVEVQFDAKSVSWRPSFDPKNPKVRLELSSSEVLRGLMGLTDALPPQWASAVDDAIAGGALAKGQPGSDGWHTIATAKG